MTKDEFVRRYHHYSTDTETLANAEAALANEEGIDGGSAVSVNFGRFGWTVMLKSAKDELIRIGIIDDEDAITRA
jgi:hypothetical protein